VQGAPSGGRTPLSMGGSHRKDTRTHLSPCRDLLTLLAHPIQPDEVWESRCLPRFTAEVTVRGRRRGCLVGSDDDDDDDADGGISGDDVRLPAAY
jgi:hypothetical protein